MKPGTNLESTFANDQRFKDHKFQYTDAAHWNSALDYEQTIYKSGHAPVFDKYSKRTDNFVTKEQAIELQRAKEEAIMRL